MILYLVIFMEWTFLLGNFETDKRWKNGFWNRKHIIITDHTKYIYIYAKFNVFCIYYII